MRQALFIKIFLIVISIVGTFLSSLFLYFLSSLRKSIDDLNKKIDDLKQRYFEDLAGMSKIFVLQSNFDKFQQSITKRVQKVQDKIQRQG